MIAATNHYDHGGYPTYIYPEEAILLFALGDILKPRRAAFLGSYYGYWASWVLPGILERGGRAVLIDPDENAQRVAQANLGKFGSSGGVEFATITGERFLDDTPDNFDLVVIDAENPRDHPDPEQRGKRVYAPLLRHALPRLAPGAVVVCHNILLKNTLQGEFFQALLARNEDELGPFMALAGCELESFTEFTSTEGVGVGRRALS
ncbi:MAG TPA: class I SAM-dependent methyltransferase [Gemmataceae bacterium]|nr:class I SAM-dependent methyltransferase [Gemmataceae bacterium]